jgi:exosortase A-associated hydrolase 1
MMAAEEAVLIACEGASLVGVLHRPHIAHQLALIVVVGGPQYRVGSHRQFVQLARIVAAAGTAVLRFDYRGMGDSDGTRRTFEGIAADIRSAIDFMLAAVPGVREVALWGLCDAASALLMYGSTDSRICGLALCNPWVRTDASLARAELKHYYGQRVFDVRRWLTLLREPRRFIAAMSSVAQALMRAVTGGTRADTGTSDALDPFPVRMQTGWDGFTGPVLLVLSGEDLTAREFTDLTKQSAAWRRLLDRSATTLQELGPADHTFSTEQWRDQVALWTTQWLRSW